MSEYEVISDCLHKVSFATGGDLTTYTRYHVMLRLAASSVWTLPMIPNRL